ncbi:hypothetical protein BOX15_Mlig014339g3 [Macrostomum lignano]|uniref:Protein MON2 homolog n=1 Tax=Macrostomum lignano TaxID=282301 RepID=A0A267GBQ1_9PLAT|nr:hypothetical protein BOX15_Mlig014339g3 [Macrostomum lignano]
MSSAQALDQVKADLRALSVESRRKQPQVRDASEAALVRLGQLNVSTTPAEQLRRELLQINSDLVRPVLLACSTKHPKLIQLALQALQRLLGARLISEESGAMVVQSMWTLMEESVEEVRLLQTAMLLVSNCPGLTGRPLSKALALVLRLHFSRSSMVTQTAAATIRQCLTAVMDRVMVEDAAAPPPTGSSSEEIQPAAEDAKNLLTDLCLLVNGEQPHWLHGLTTMTRSLGLELLHAALADFPKVFSGNPHFTRLLKEQVCPLIIRLFGPTHKHSQAANSALSSTGISSGGGASSYPAPPAAPLGDLPPTAASMASSVSTQASANFAIHVRLHRLVGVLLHSYFGLVSTECEIFLTLLIRLVDSDKWPWQRMLALEVLHKLVQRPGLVAAICCAYDMKRHASKIFAVLVGALAGYVQGVFTAPREVGVGAAGSSGSAAMKETPPAMLGGMQVGPGSSPSPCFVYKGLIVPLHTSPKAVYLDMLDKQEPPPPPEGQALSLAFYTLVEVIRSVQAIIEDRCQPPSMCESLLPPPAGSANSDQSTTDSGAGDGKREELHNTLVSSLWCAALAALSLLLETSTDESATESILKSLETMVSLCGRLGLTTPRDAFITAMCKASLPAAYALAVLSSASVSQHHKGSSAGQSSSSTFAAANIQAATAGAAATASSAALAAADLTPSREFNQVVVVGPALPTPGLSSGSAAVELGKVHLTAKNMQCMRAILSVAHCHGAILGTAWHLLLTTLQHLTWVLGLKPVSGGSLVHAKGSGESGTVVTTAVVADLAVLSSMLSRLFESSQFLDDVALHHLISALCKLSMEAMQLASANKEPSLFAVAKLQETGLVNLKRMEVLWKPVTHHLLEVASHSHPGLRNLATDALISLVNAAVECVDVEISDSADETSKSGAAAATVWESDRLARLVLEPLYQLSQYHADTRTKQLACLQHLLNVCGDRLGPHWKRFIQVVGEINGHESHSEAHIRLAFRCLQQILTDFLSTLSLDCYEACIDVTASFAKQQQDLNIALTAVGCVWNITDYFFGKQPIDSGDWKPDQLWICVQVKLKDLCLDPRPAVRKSAGQTLFNTIGSHGRHLQADTWRVVLWKVLFPLLESVSEAALAAAEADAKQAAEPQGGGAGGGGILMHHSRDTVGKQWAETQTLALAGVASVFHAQQRLLLGLNDFARAWKLLLECIEQSALSANSEIAQNALNSFQELANLDASADTQEVLWQLAWHSWLRIAQQGSLPRPGPPILVPSQDFLTSLCRLLPCLFNRVTTSFGQADFTQLSAGLSQALVCPILSDSRAPYILPTNYFDSGLTPLQESVIAALETLARAFLLGPESLRPQLPNFFNLLSVYANYAVHTPKPAKLTPAADNRPENFVSLSYVAFGERCFELMVDLYKDCASQPVVVRAAVLEGMYKALRQPLCIKYNCPSQSTWRLAYKCLTSLIVCGTPVARQHADHFSGMWDALAQAIEDFLFAPHKYPPGLTVEDFEEHEALDCALVTLVRDTFLSRPDGVPVQFVDRMIALLNRGSIHSVPVSAAASDLELHRWLREELAQLCFHTLLSYSFSVEANGAATGGGGGSGGEARGAVSRAAVRTILTRCRDVLRKFVDDQRLSGHCPLPRARLTEVGLSLKALSSLLTAFKAAPQDRVDPQAWQILLDTYPAVVEAVLPNCTNFLKPLKELLHLYSDLLRVPQSAE